MEDIIFILLAFVWLMYSLYKGKSKKKKQEKPVPQTSDQPKSEKKDFETIFREILGEEEAEEATIEEDTVAETATPEMQTSQMSEENQSPDEYEQHTGLTGVSDDFEFSAEGKIETIEDQLDKQHFKKESQLEVIDLWDEEEDPDLLYFDPYKAIIYSEIINPKY